MVGRLIVFLLGRPIFRGYVSFREGMLQECPNGHSSPTIDGRNPANHVGCRKAEVGWNIHYWSLPIIHNLSHNWWPAVCWINSKVSDIDSQFLPRSKTGATGSKLSKRRTLDNYTPQNKHGTWKWTPGKGDSYWKPSFPGSMLIFWGVLCF